MTPDPDRRAFLRGLSLSPFVLTGVGVFSGAVRAQAAEAGLIAPNVCLVSPEVTAGPFWFDPALERSEIAEGRPGMPLALRLQVVTPDCAPVSGVRVAVWHCDADGAYSGYDGQGDGRATDARGETFLRGSQPTDGQGVARFSTIYPGWYRGRTPHVHVKVFLDGRMALTSQIFFPDALSDYLYRYVAPYAARGRERDTSNRTDRLARQAGEGAFALIREVEGGYEAAMVLGIEGSEAPG